MLRWTLHFYEALINKEKADGKRRYSRNNEICNGAATRCATHRAPNIAPPRAGALRDRPRDPGSEGRMSASSKKIAQAMLRADAIRKTSFDPKGDGGFGSYRMSWSEACEKACNEIDPTLYAVVSDVCIAGSASTWDWAEEQVKK